MVRAPRSATRSVLLLLGAFAFAFCLGMTVHELGHLVAIRLLGITEVTVSVHPFRPSYTSWNATRGGLGYVDAAGPLGNVLLSTVVVALLWRKRSPYLLPLLLWAPMAYIGEGFNSMMQLLLDVPGSDSVNIVVAGAPFAVVLATAAVLFIVGVVTFCLQLPLLGVSPRDSFWRVLCILVIGLAPYMILVLLYAVAFSPPDITRGVVLLAFVTLLATLLAAICRPLRRILGRHTDIDAAAASWGAAQVSLGTGVGMVAGLILVSL